MRNYGSLGELEDAPRGRSGARIGALALIGSTLALAGVVAVPRWVATRLHTMPSTNTPALPPNSNTGVLGDAGQLHTMSSTNTPALPPNSNAEVRSLNM